MPISGRKASSLPKKGQKVEIGVHGCITALHPGEQVARQPPPIFRGQFLMGHQITEPPVIFRIFITHPVKSGLPAVDLIGMNVGSQGDARLFLLKHRGQFTGFSAQCRKR